MDFFQAPIPGESLTTSFGSNPIEQQPKITSIEDAAQMFYETTEADPKLEERLAYLMDAGVSVETLSTLLVKNYMYNGLINPDLGILLMPIVAAKLARIAEEAELTDVILENSPKEDELDDVVSSENHKLHMMKTLNPVKYKKLLENSEKSELVRAPKRELNNPELDNAVSRSFMERK